jgi:hypothetical protein
MMALSRVYTRVIVRQHLCLLRCSCAASEGGRRCRLSEAGRGPSFSPAMRASVFSSARFKGLLLSCRMSFCVLMRIMSCAGYVRLCVQLKEAQVRAIALVAATLNCVALVTLFNKGCRGRG